MKSLRHLAFAILTAGIGSAIVVVGFPSAASAAIYTWTGGAGNSNWLNVGPPQSLTANWTPTSPVFGTADTIVFGTAPANRLAPNQNLAASIGNIIFTGSAPTYSITGATSLTITGSVANQSANMQSIVGNGPVVLSGAVINTGSAGITLTRAFNASTGNFTKSGSGLLTINTNASLYTGTATINSGSVAFAVGLNSNYNGGVVLKNGATGTSNGIAFNNVVGEYGSTMNLSGGTVTSGSFGGAATSNNTAFTNLVTGTGSVLTMTAGSITSGTIQGTFELVGSPATQVTASSLTLTNSAKTVLDITSDPNIIDSLSGNSLTYGGTMAFTFNDENPADVYTEWTVFDYTTKSGSFAGVTLTSTNPDYSSISGGAWHLAQNGNQYETAYGAGVWLSDWTTGNQRFIFSQNTGVLTLVPEPSTIVFAGIGVAMLGWHTWTRSRRRARMKALEDHVRRGDGVTGRA